MKDAAVAAIGKEGGLYLVGASELPKSTWN
jgi:hypothetical protein